MTSKQSWDPDEYSKTIPLRINLAFDVLTKCGYRLQPDDKVLDIGCGNGWITAEIANRIPQGHITGIDPSDTMLDFAINKFHHSNLLFEKKDATKMVYENQFDLIISFFALHWVADQLTVLRNVQKALKQNGHAIFLLNPKADFLWDALDRVMSEVKWQRYFAHFIDPYCFYNEENYTALAQQTGLKIIQIEQIHYPVGPSKKALLDILSGWLPQLSVIPEKRKSDFMVDLGNHIDQILPKYGLKDYTDLTYPNLQVHLQKM